jgi:hypothetical protein
MKPISTLMHGVIDYATVATIMAGPRRMSMSPALSGVLAMSAIGSLGYSLMTRYELGVVKTLPMKTHLMLDAIVGAKTLMLPFLFSRESMPVKATLFGLGLFELAAAYMTQPEPGDVDMLPGMSGAAVDRVQDMVDRTQARAGEMMPV